MTTTPTDTEGVDELARVAYGAVRGTSPVAFDDLPDAARDQYRAVVNAIADAMAPRVSALARTLVNDIGNRMLAAEHKAAKLADTLHETREWALEADGDKKDLDALVRAARPFVNDAKWRGQPDASELLERIDAKLAVIDAG